MVKYLIVDIASVNIKSTLRKIKTKSIALDTFSHDNTYFTFAHNHQ